MFRLFMSCKVRIVLVGFVAKFTRKSVFQSRRIFYMYRLFMSCKVRLVFVGFVANFTSKSFFRSRRIY